MVSQCKHCGERTSGHRQYCPHCRINVKGRSKSSPEIVIMGLWGMCVLIFYFAYYSFKQGNFSQGFLVGLFGIGFSYIAFKLMSKIMAKNKPNAYAGESRMVSRQVFR